MGMTISERLTRDFSKFTKAEKAIANYMLSKPDRLLFDTAASIAEGAGVSQMTVSRFLRTIGYQDSGAFKEEVRAQLGAKPLLVSDRIGRIRRDGEADDRIPQNLELEIDALLSAYEQRDTPAWRVAVDALAASDRICVSGFQTIRGIASDFAGRLSYLRPETRFIDGSDGTFAELLAGSGGSSCLVLFEMRRYTRLSHLLARAAAAQKMKIVIICDTHCYWARDFTDIVLSLRTDSRFFWDTQTPFVSLGGLLLDDVTAALGEHVSERVEMLRQLQDQFEAFQD